MIRHIVRCSAALGLSACAFLGACGSSRPVPMQGDFASVSSKVWCMESNEALSELQDLAARENYDGMEQAFLSKGVATLQPGDRVRVLDRTFGSSVRVRIAGGRECWTVVNVLRKAAPGEPEPSRAPAATNPAQAVIGKWRDPGLLGGAVIRIYNEKNRLYIEETFSDGSSSKDEAVEKPSPLGRRFEATEPSAAGDHFVIDGNGDLQIRDREGLIRTAGKIR